MSFYIPFICENDSNSDMYAISADNREHQPNSIRYRVLAKNYFNPSQKWWRSSPFYSKSKLKSGARVLVENGELLPAWRYSLLANEREKWMRDYWLQSCRNLFYSLQSDEYILPSTKSDPEDKSYCFVNGICTTLRSKNIHGMSNMSMLPGFQVPRKIINSQYVNTPLAERLAVGITKDEISVQVFLEARNIFRSLVDGAILREILIYQGTTTSIPHSEMEQWMSILFAEDEILVEKSPRSEEIYWPVEAINLFTRRQDIVENLRGKSEDDLLELRNIARSIERFTVQEIKAGDALVDVELYKSELLGLLENFTQLESFFADASFVDKTIEYCLDHMLSVQHPNSLQSQVYISSCLFLLSRTNVEYLSSETKEKLQLLNQFMTLIPEVYSKYKAGLFASLENHPTLETHLHFIRESSGVSSELSKYGVAWDIEYSHQSSVETDQDIPLSIQLEMEMGVLDFSQDELDVSMKKVKEGDSLELQLLKNIPIRIRGERENEIDIHYYLVLGDEVTYKVEFKKQILDLSQKNNTDYIFPLEKGTWKISYEKQQLRFRIR